MTTQATTPSAPAPAADPAIDRHHRFMTHNYPRYGVTMVSGAGCRLTDSQGKRYLDLFSGFGAGILGHCHEDLVAAATKQVNRLWHVGNLMHTEPQTQLAELISRTGFNGRSFFCHSGSDANEAAFKLARLYGKRNPGKTTDALGRYGVVSTSVSFHGRGFAAMMATGQDKVRLGYAPYLDGFKHVPFNDLPAMQAAIDERTVAIIVEPIQGEGGINVPDDRYLPALRKLCDERDLLLIVDEVWTGCGRTGKWFAYQHAGIEPDMMTLAKAIGCGLPVGVMCAHPRVAHLFDFDDYGGVPHATTLGGNCVSMAVAARMFEVIERDGLLHRAASLGEKIKTKLRAMGDRTGLFGDVRGRGLFLGLTLRPDAPGASFDNAATLARRALDRGLLIGTAQQQVVRLAPPLVVTDEEIEEGLRLLESILTGA